MVLHEGVKNEGIEVVGCHMWQHTTPPGSQLSYSAPGRTSTSTAKQHSVIVSSPIQVVGSEVCQDRLLHLLSQV